MGPWEYIIVKIDGDYASLERTDSSDREQMPIALALLPFGVDVGTRLRWENFQYEVI